MHGNFPVHALFKNPLKMRQFKIEIINSEKSLYTKQEILGMMEEIEESNRQKLESKDVIVNKDEYTVEYKGVKKTLPRKVTELICYFISNEGKFIPRSKILNDVWGSDLIVGDRTVDVHVRLIRKNLFDKCITTVKGVGYKW
jgi:two-component system alkaline phosphatase synthesis response regulator PhoP